MVSIKYTMHSEQVAKKQGWDIESILGSLHWLFKDSPARYEDFKTATKCTLLNFASILLLLLSHGQASVERGFSVNKEVMVQNLAEQSLISQRII